MTQTSFPFEGIDTTETQFSRWARHFNNGVNDEPTGDALEVSAGTGLAVDVEPGEAMVRGHYYISDAVESLALATADASNDRIDVVVLRLDPTANSIVVAVKTGTPAGSPAAPALVQTDAGIFEQALANVLVPATSGVPTTITDRREFMGTRLGSWTTDGRPDPAGRVLFGFNTTTEVVEVYDVINSVWKNVGVETLAELTDTDITTPSAGQKLIYNGSDWVNDTGYLFRQTEYFTSNGTFTKASYPWLRAIRVRMVGGGGSASGSPATGSNQRHASRGGGGGAYAESFITDIAGLDASVTVTRGAGGTGATAGGLGNPGGNSSFGSLVSANGGIGGSADGQSNATLVLYPGVEGSSIATGDLVIAGGPSSPGVASTLFSVGSYGGRSFLSPETHSNSGFGASVTSKAGVNYGAGSSGTTQQENQAAKTSAAGGNGIVIVELYA